MDGPVQTWLERWRLLIVHGQDRKDTGEHGELPDAQRAWFVRFHILFAVLAVFSAVAATTDGSVALAKRLLAVGILVFLVVWFDRQVWKCGHHGATPAVLYIVVGLPLFFVLINLHPAYQLLIFVAYWQIFALLRPWHAIFGAAVLTLMLLVTFAEGPVRFPLTEPTDWIIFTASLVMGGSMAAFIENLISEGHKRRVLIEELEATREQLARSEREAGVLSERQRIAGEIHDTIAQDLTSVVMHLEAALGRFGSAHHPAVDHIEQGAGAARTGIAEARRLVHALLPEVLESQSLTGAIQLSIDKWRRSAGVDASFQRIGDEPELPRQVEVTLLRAVQEALTNVRKHASARSVVVTMTNLADELALDIHDDGSGFDAGAPGTIDPRSRNGAGGGIGMGLGLATLGERIHSLGGELTIESAPATGSTISISLPLPVGSAQPRGPRPKAPLVAMAAAPGVTSDGW